MRNLIKIKIVYCILYIVYCTSVFLFIYRSGTSQMKVVVVYFKKESGAHPQLIIGEGADSMAIYNLCSFIKTAL